VYHAVVTRSPEGGREQVWFSLPDGRFRLSRVNQQDSGPRLRTTTVFDGAHARRSSGTGRPSVLEAIRGPAERVSAYAGDEAVALLAAYLERTPAPAGASLSVRAGATGVSIVATTPSGKYALRVDPVVHGVPPALFRLPAGIPQEVETVVRPGTPPPATGPVYWLGSAFRGSAPTLEVAGSHGTLTVAYPGVEVESGPPLGGSPSGAAVRLADGTPAQLLTAATSADGSYSFSYPLPAASCPSGADACGNIDTFFGLAGSSLGAAPVPGGIVALIFTPAGIVTLAGPAVTRATATALASQLRRA
jgi:hypothetical protein